MENIDLELYRLFYVVAKNGNMTKASEELHISQPAISQSIKKLESQLDGTLFLRSRKGMELTGEGKMFYDYIKGALELIENAENEFSSFKDLSVGEIKIGASTTLTKTVLMDAIKKFHAKYPSIEIKITNDLTSNLILDLLKGKLDFVIFNEGDAKEKGVDIETIKKMKHGFLYNPNFFDDNIKAIEDLKKYPLILQHKQSNSRKFLDNYTLSQNVMLEAKTEVVSQDLLLEFTDAGFGIGFGIVDLAQKTHPSLKELEINKNIPESNIYLAKNKNLILPFASKEFLKYIKK
ncbi:MAG: LysR family transcriptional regulator [Clostridia bacterium]|nr:LysR family transcriptional regulator [Clostridia bacterium]